MQKAFLKLDKDKDGTLSIQELMDGLKIGENKKEIKKILNQVDTDHNGKISYTGEQSFNNY
jgi:Ca2+-binding EF-hand superfamily protein